MCGMSNMKKPARNRNEVQKPNPCHVCSVTEVYHDHPFAVSSAGRRFYLCSACIEFLLNSKQVLCHTCGCMAEPLGSLLNLCKDCYFGHE